MRRHSTELQQSVRSGASLSPVPAHCYHPLGMLTCLISSAASNFPMPAFVLRLTLVLLAFLAAARGAAAVEQIDVFTAGQEGYHTYRIPTVVRAKDGMLLAFCEGR